MSTLKLFSENVEKESSWMFKIRLYNRLKCSRGRFSSRLRLILSLYAWNGMRPNSILILLDNNNCNGSLSFFFNVTKNDC